MFDPLEACAAIEDPEKNISRDDRRQKLLSSAEGP
jgi:hypothetical protein